MFIYIYRYRHVLAYVFVCKSPSLLRPLGRLFSETREPPQGPWSLVENEEFENDVAGLICPRVAVG